MRASRMNQRSGVSERQCATGQAAKIFPSVTSKRVRDEVLVWHTNVVHTGSLLCGKYAHFFPVGRIQSNDLVQSPLIVLKNPRGFPVRRHVA